MKTASISKGLQPVTRPDWRGNGVRLLLAAGGWMLFLLFSLFTEYLIGWTTFAVALLGKVSLEVILPFLLVSLLIAAGLAWLVARFIASPRTVWLAILATGTLMLAAGVIWRVAYPDPSLFWARQLAWGESSQTDYQYFPERTINNAATVFHFKQSLPPESLQTVEYYSAGEPKMATLEDFLVSTKTTSFIVLRDDTILYEGYFNGYERDSIVTSFSVSKSFTSALVGIAVDEGYIGDVDDLMIEYIPELQGKGFDQVTIRDLLLMSAGIRFLSDDEISPLAELTQFTDEGLCYSYPDLRSLALQIQPDGNPPGAEFNYNNYHLLLLGMILERSTGQPPAEYLQEKIWKPLGMEYPASWSLDSEESGFELMVSGINARAIDFAKFGRLYLNNGNWEGTQILSEQWVAESTAHDPQDQRTWHDSWFTSWKEKNGYYKYLWWGRTKPDGSYDFTAMGKDGQWIYVAPQERMVIVRFGLEDGGVDDWADVFQGIIAKAGKAAAVALPDHGLPASTPEEQGFDSAKLAEGLLAIQKNGTAIHSLMILRKDRVILDAYFYPFEGSMVHDLASVTKSVITTLIGIAADQGRLSLDDPLLSFFPDRMIANRDERKEQILVRHLASMSSGMECDPIDEITLMEMRASKDWVQFALDRRAVRQPGTDFAYCGLDMHLLSAILQQATGMPALAFGREYLFEPLGIQDVYWPSDPQGITHGWGDIALHPADMARLGSLYMHQGQWDGRQIVSSEWVESALQPYFQRTGRIEDYGYGWWVGQPENEPEFLATGNGGQKIKVYPRLQMIIVTTGGGFEYSAIEPYLLAAMSNMEIPLPPNPGGVARLQAAVEAIAQGPEPQPVPSLPNAASTISGKTFVFEPNRMGLLSVRLDFDDSDEVLFRIEIANEPGPRLTGVGLDGLYRPSRSGRPTLARGSWVDPQTFVIDYNEGPGFATYEVRLHFEGHELIFEIPGLGRYIAK